MAVKTTLNIDTELMLKAKRLASERGITLTKVVEDALREALAEQPALPAYEFRWETTKGTEWPAVDPANRDDLYDLLEGPPF